MAPGVPGREGLRGAPSPGLPGLGRVAAAFAPGRGAGGSGAAAAADEGRRQLRDGADGGLPGHGGRDAGGVRGLLSLTQEEAACGRRLLSWSGQVWSRSQAMSAARPVSGVSQTTGAPAARTTA